MTDQRNKPDPYQEGWAAYEAGGSITENPYPAGSSEAEDWRLGFGIASMEDSSYEDE